MRGWRVWGAAVAAMVGIVCAAQAQQTAGVAFERAQRLQRGVNLSGFYSQTKDFSAARLNAYMSVADMQALKSMGFDHVRLGVDPKPLIQSAETGALRADAMAQLDKTVQQLMDAGLNVVLDIQPEESWKAAMTGDDDGVARLIAFWQQFAGHYATRDPERVFFEIMNEPSMDDLYRWQGIQARVAAAIRRVAPRHTMIATAARWGHQDGLLAMEPVRDEDVIYTFHDYDPMWFTHQGATWGMAEWANLRGVPYPSTPENVQPVLAQEPDEKARLELKQYGEERWDAARVETEIAAVAAWAEVRDVPLYCGEFGVYRNFADPKMRVAWIEDTRTSLQRHRIGWAMWDYDGNFGLAVKQSYGIAVDSGALGALGMGR